MTTFKANRKFPNPVTVTDDPKSHTLALQQIIEALNVGQRRTREINSSYVRVHELVDVGLVEIVGNQLKLTNAGAAAVAAGASALADLTDVDLTGLADGNTLVWDSATSTWVPGTAAYSPMDDGAIMMRAASAQSVTSGAQTVVTFDTEVRDDNGYVNLGTYNSRFTIPATGWYLLHAQVRFTANSNGVRSIWWGKNGDYANDRYGQVQCSAADGSSQDVIQSNALVYASTGDYFELCVVQTSGSTLTAVIYNTGGNDSAQPIASIHRLARPAITGGGGGSFVPSDLYDASLSDLVDVGVYMPSDGDILTWNSALGIWEAGESTTTEPDNVAEFFDDFLYHAASEFYQNASTWRSLASSSNSFSNLAAEAGHPGIIRATHANLTNGSYTIWCLTNDQNSGTWNQWFVNGGNELIFEASLRVSALPSSADNISYRASFQNVNNATHLAGFILDWDGASARWYLGNAAGGTWETTLLTTNLPTANTWFKVRVVVTSTAVRYYVDDVLLATHTDAAKIPTAALTAYFTTARAAAGAATRTMDIDYCLIRQKFASGRPA